MGAGLEGGLVIVVIRVCIWASCLEDPGTSCGCVGVRAVTIGVLACLSWRASWEIDDLVVPLTDGPAPCTMFAPA